MSASLLPRKTRLVLGGLSVVAHIGAVVALGIEAQQVNVLEPINVDVIPQGDYTVDTVVIAGAAASEAVEQHQMQEPVPEPKPQDVAEEKPEIKPEAESKPEPQPVIAPDPKILQAELEVKELLRKLEAKRRAEAAERLPDKRLREKRHRWLLAHRDEIRNARSSNQGGSEGHRAGVPNGQAVRAARLNYGAIISAELNRHKAYPAAARARREMGSVGVSFTVGGSGRIVSHSIYSSSGSSSLDGEVVAMMTAARAPPPPGGIFHGSIVVHFTLGR